MVVFGEWIVLYLDDIAIELGKYGSRILALGKLVKAHWILAQPVLYPVV